MFTDFSIESIIAHSLDLFSLFGVFRYNDDTDSNSKKRRRKKLMLLFTVLYNQSCALNLSFIHCECLKNTKLSKPDMLIYTEPKRKNNKNKKKKTVSLDQEFVHGIETRHRINSSKLENENAHTKMNSKKKDIHIQSVCSGSSGFCITNNNWFEIFFSESISANRIRKMK